MNDNKKRIITGEEQFRYIFEHANESIIVVQDGLIKLLNPKVIETIGYSEETIKSKPFIEFIHKDDQEMVFNYYVKRLQGEDIPAVYPFRIIDNKGDIKWAEINVVAIDWECRPATLSFLNDITERKKVEEERKRLILELQETLEKVNTLSGLLPICAWCKKLRDDKGYWNSVEEYISAHTGAEFTHGMCPECLEKYFSEESAERNGKENNSGEVR